MSGLFGNLGGQAQAQQTSNSFGTTLGSTSKPSLFSLPQSGQPAASSAAGGGGGGLFGTAASATPGGGLFGASTSRAATGPAGGGIFGNANKPAQAGGLFGATNSATQPIQTGGLFGASPAQSAAPAPGGLFSGLGKSQPIATGGLFGGATTTTQAQQPGGLFGGLGTATQPQQTSGALFGGGITATQPSQQPGALGASLLSGLGQSQPTTQQVQPADSNAQIKSAASLQAAYFDQILERGKKRNQQHDGPNGLGDLPTLQLGLGDIARKVKNLGQGGLAAGSGLRPNDSRAHYLLAASGVSTTAAIRDLHNLNAQSGGTNISPPKATSDTDIESFIYNLQSQTTLELIQQGLDQSKRDFDAFLEENVQMNWDAQRWKIYEHFGLAKPSAAIDDGDGISTSQRERGAFGRTSRRSKPLSMSSAGMSFGPAMTRSVLGNSAMRGSVALPSFTDLPEKTSSNSIGSSLDDRVCRDKQEKYASTIFSLGNPSLNGARNSESCYPLLHQFSEVEKSAGIDQTTYLVHAYHALISITGEAAEAVPFTQPSAVKERHFAKQYLDDTPTSAASIAMRKRILNGSRKCLEEIYLKKVDDVVMRDPRAAQVGGEPTKVGLIRGFVRVLDSRKELGDTAPLRNIQLPDGNQDYVWVIIYTFLRCGLLDEALEYVNQNQSAVRVLDSKFQRFLQEYANSEDRNLSRESCSKIANDYNQVVKTSADGTIDPYRIACHKIIGRCELSRRLLDGIKTDEEDWVWLQFALAREVSRSEEQAGEVFGLQQIQETISDIGKRHFSQSSDGATGYGLFFFMQILAGMFEQAIAWLYPKNHITAVHVAIALAYYGLLRVSDLSASELLSFTMRQQPRLNFALMIGYYTSDFRAARPESAADYLCLLNLNSDLPGDAGIQQAKICYEALRELVLETREFAALLGDLRKDGTRVDGAIGKRSKLIKLKDDYHTGKRKTQDDIFETKKFMEELTVQAATSADESGRTTDAVLLNHLAGNFEAVIDIINRALSEALTVPIELEPLRVEATKPATESQAQTDAEASTFSLATVDDPVVLAHNFTALYGSNAVITREIKESTRIACQILLTFAEAKHMLRERLFDPALANKPADFQPVLQVIDQTRILPISSRSDMVSIRTYAQNFGKQPQVVARVVGDVMLWAIEAVRQQKILLRQTQYGDVEEQIAGLEGVARDLVVFAGLVRFRLSPRVFEELARVSGDGI